jgi:hypothetical protein
MENNYEPSHSYLEHGRLDYSLPRAIRLRFQRSDHVAISEMVATSECGGNALRAPHRVRGRVPARAIVLPAPDAAGHT